MQHSETLQIREKTPPGGSLRRCGSCAKKRGFGRWL